MATKSPNRKNVAVVAVDPGVGGGIGWLIPTGPTSRIAGCAPLGDFHSIRGQIKVIRQQCPPGIDLVGFVELLQPMMGRKRGSFGTWKLAVSMTEARCAMLAENVPVYMTKPEVWERKLGVYKKTKIEKREQARAWYPARAADELEPLHGLCREADKVAEAILIADFGWRTMGNM